MANVEVGRRIQERILARGYRQPNGKPDVKNFSFDYRFDKNHLHSWIRGMVPFKELIRLCHALDCSAEFLLTGEERKKAAPGKTRPRIKSLLLVLAAASAALGLWPSPSAGAPTQTLQDTESGLRCPSYRKKPYHGMVYA
jgi:hypothetical protein